MEHAKFTKYEIARIIGARALQIAMDAPLLMRISEEELKEIKYDAISIAEKEFQAGILPIAVNRPSPRKKKEKLQAVKEESVSDEELIAKEKEVEKEIVEDAEELGLVQTDEVESTEETAGSEEQ
jgi:DNA-directed RNA polymerase subunit K